MAKQNRTTLKGYFETGDIPNQNQYADLIDSNLNLSETTDQTTAGGLNITGNVTSSGNITASGDIFGLSLTVPGNITGSTIEGQTLTADVFLSAPSASITNLTNTNITSSGHISASGNITASGLYSTGQISASGNIISPQITSSGGILNKGNLFQEKSIALNQNKPLQARSGSSYADLIKLDSNHITLVGNNNANQTEFLTFASFKFKTKIDKAYPPASPLNDGTIIRMSGGFGEPAGLYVHGAISASRTITGNNLNLDGSQVDFTNLPTSDPNVAGRLYNDGGSLKISAG